MRTVFAVVLFCISTWVNAQAWPAKPLRYIVPFTPGAFNDTLGRTISEAYHRLNTLTAEVRRCIVAEQIAALKGTRPAYRSRAEIEEMYRFAERIIYPTRADHVMHDEAAE